MTNTKYTTIEDVKSVKDLIEKYYFKTKTKFLDGNKNLAVMEVYMAPELVNLNLIGKDVPDRIHVKARTKYAKVTKDQMEYLKDLCRANPVMVIEFNRIKNASHINFLENDKETLPIAKDQRKFKQIMIKEILKSFKKKPVADKSLKEIESNLQTILEKRNLRKAS